jgi:hypothetical protein
VKNTVAEVAMTRANAVSNQLAQRVQALDFRKLVSLQTIFGHLFQMRDALYRVVHIFLPSPE